MSKPRHLSERSIRKLLSDHVEQGIPDDVDLWHAVQRRLAEREGAAEQPSQARWFDWLLGAPVPHEGATAGTKTPRRAYRYAQLAAGIVGLLLVAGLTTLVISRLAARPSITPSSAGTPTVGSQLPQNTPASTIATAEAITPANIPATYPYFCPADAHLRSRHAGPKG